PSRLRCFVSVTGIKRLDISGRRPHRMHNLEAEIRALRAEPTKEAIKETQQMVNAVQGEFFRRLENITVRVALMEAGHTSKTIGDSSSTPGLPKGGGTQDEKGRARQFRNGGTRRRPFKL